jgi:hypothetical protein
LETGNGHTTVTLKGLTFKHCVNGSSVGFGGAVNLYNFSAMFDHCAFVNNSAYRTGTWNGGSGGAMRINRSTATLIEPIIERNLATYGGGICAADSDLFIYGGRIMYNEAREVNLSPTSKLGGVGGAIDLLHSKVLLARVFIANNEAPISSALNVSKDSDVRVIDSTIVS